MNVSFITHHRQNTLMKTKFIAQVVVFALLVVSHSGGNAQNYQKASIYRNGKVVETVEFDSMSVHVTEGPSLPIFAKDVYVQVNQDVYHNGEKMVFKTPDDDEPKGINLIKYLNGHFYAYQRETVWEGTKYHDVATIWKDGEFLLKYNPGKPFWMMPDFDIDGDDVYIYGQAMVSTYDGGIISYDFITKNGETIEYSREMNYKDIYVDNGTMYKYYNKIYPPSYHSVGSYYQTPWIACLEYDNNVYELASRDASRLQYISTTKFRNGIPYASGYFNKLKDNSQTFDNIAWFAKGASSCEEIPGVLRSYSFEVDEEGNYYVLASTPDEEGYIDGLCLVKNGAKLYDLTKIEVPDNYEMDYERANVFLVGEDIYISGYFHYNDENSDFHRAGFLLKNNQLVWGLENDMIINNIITVE